METTGTISDVSLDYKTRKIKVSMVLDVDINYIEQIEKVKSEPKLDIKFDKHRNKRSNDANAYCWKLCDLIAKELSKDGTVFTKEDVYKDTIKQIGTYEAMIIEEKAFDNFKRVWESYGTGFVIQVINKKDKCVKFHAYYGSHTYNTKEMSLLINLLIQIAKDLGIETRPQAEINSLLESWK